LVSTVNSLVTAYNAHKHPAPGGTTSPTGSQAGSAASFQSYDYENFKITH